MNRKMKDSGVEWIGEIPEGWGVEPLKRLFSFGKGLPITKEQLLQEGLPVISYGQIHAKSNLGTRITEELIRFVATDYAERYPDSFAGINSFIVADTSEDIEGCGNSVYNDSIGTLFAGYHSIILKPTFSESARYYAYFFNSAAWRTQVRVQVSGVKVFSISQKILKNTVVLSPTKEEQQRIADFLDTQTAEIDASIAKTQESIEEYKKLKQAVITQAVTKGIRPGRAMKDSGVEWIGDIPEEWKAAPVKHYLRLQTGTTPSSQHPEYFNGEIPWYTPGDILDKVELTNSERTLKREAISDGIVPLYPPDSVLIVGIGATLGKTGHIDRPASSNQQITALSPRDNTCCGRYVAYCFKSMEAKLKDFAFYTTLPIINNRTLGQFRCPFPPLPEQQEIAAYLDEKCAAIDTLIEKKQQIITELDAYKKSLIYEYVTGKKEVPMAT